MGSSQSVSSREHVLVVGGTGRTGRRLINQLCDDPRFEVTAVVRDREDGTRHSWFLATR